MRRVALALLIGLLIALAGTPGARADDAPGAEPAPRDLPEAPFPSTVDPEAYLAEHAAEYAEPAAAERILDYDSRIVVAADGGMTVTETIVVQAAGEQINHGIFRDFPTLYKKPAFEHQPILDLPMLENEALFTYRVEVPFDVVRVERDGRPEPYETSSVSNGVRVKIGDGTVTLPPGRYTYRLTYTTARQLGFFPDHDELYWNVTGNGWAFPIDRAAATVVLPAEIPRDRVTLEGYTGPQGSTERRLTSAVAPDGTLRFVSTERLAPYSGLTIVAGFPRGVITAPTAAEQREALLRANPIFVVGPIGVGLVVLYYLGAWWTVGRDPRRGTIIPLFEPPLGLDAAGMRYIAGLGFDERCFAVALLGLAAKGWARIVEKDGDFTIEPATQRHTPLGSAEKKVNAQLLGGSAIELKQKNHSQIRSAITGLSTALRSEYEGATFRLNRRWVIPGRVLSVLCIVAAAVAGGPEQIFAVAFMAVWLTVWTFACIGLAQQLWRAWREVARPGAGLLSRTGALMLALIATAIGLPFFFGEAMGLVFFVGMTSVWMGILLVVLVGLNLFFYELLKQPTRFGRELMDQIEGFKMYLTTAEGAELAQAAPAKTPQLYERLLPYAIALDVENEWSAQFASVLARATQADEAYKPTWFAGNSFNRFGTAHFASAMTSSLSTTVSSSSTAPGSRSGSSGGGSAGGGGGGGGGGGW
jgi:uncharacterized membrane protein YgcG